MPQLWTPGEARGRTTLLSEEVPRMRYEDDPRVSGVQGRQRPVGEGDCLPGCLLLCEKVERARHVRG